MTADPFVGYRVVSLRVRFLDGTEDTRLVRPTSPADGPPAAIRVRRLPAGGEAPCRLVGFDRGVVTYEEVAPCRSTP